MPYTSKELLSNEYFQSLVNADEKEYNLKRDAAMVKADISGSNVRLLCTPASSDSTVIKFDRTLVDA